MVDKETFFKEFNGHGNYYSSYKLIDVDAKSVIKMLNEVYEEKDMAIGSGDESTEKGHRVVSFEICKELPDAICSFTEVLNCRGFADIGAWFGEGYHVFSVNGEESDDYEAYWKGDSPYLREEDGYEEDDEDALYDAFMYLIDKKTGIRFDTGDGAVDRDIVEGYQEEIYNH